MIGTDFVAKGINVSSRIIGEVAYIYLEDKKELVQFNEVGSFVWSCVTGTKCVDQIVALCREQYDDPSGQIPEVVADFLDELEEEGFIVSSATKFEGVMANG